MNCGLFLREGYFKVFSTYEDIGYHQRYHQRRENLKRKETDPDDFLNDDSNDRTETTHVRESSFENFYGVNRQFFELENERRGGEHIFSLIQFSLSTLSNRVSKIETYLHLNMAYLLNNTSVKTHEIILSVMNTLAEIQK